MQDTPRQFEEQCRIHMDRFFDVQPDSKYRAQAYKILRLLRASEKPLKGKPEGWAAGIIYVAANDGRIPFGVPGLLNTEFEKLMGVSMEVVRDRAAKVRMLIEF